MNSSATPEPSSTADIWTTRRLLRWMREFLEMKTVESPRVVSEKLLAHVLKCDRTRLYMEVDRPASAKELESLRELVRRAGRQEPVQYLIGRESFFLHDLEVNSATLIPRPCTETLVQLVIEEARQRKDDEPLRLADIGTGTGCIAIALAHALPKAIVVATDVDEAILQLAVRNAATANVADRIEFRLGSTYDPLGEPASEAARFDFLCSNPPYISDHEWSDVPPNVRDYEPERALRGGRDGLDVIRPLIIGADGFLRAGGRLAIEIAASKEKDVIALVNAAAGLEDPVVHDDHEGLPRVLVARRRDV